MFSKRKNKNRDLLTPEEAGLTIGDHLSFASAEAYRLLRTNLSFTLPDETGCKIIGITSALKDEGKSTTAVNIAYTMAQEGGRVLLIECDMRLPSLSRRIPVQPTPGLSNFLVGQCSISNVIQRSTLKPNLWVMTAGDLPPNPAELLGSKHMAATLNGLKARFDVILLDLPPLSLVSDALIVSKLVHGMILVVRQGYCNRKSLDDAMRQLRFASANILGFVMTGAGIPSKNDTRHGCYYSYYGQAKQP